MIVYGEHTFSVNKAYIPPVVLLCKLHNAHVVQVVFWMMNITHPIDIS